MMCRDSASPALVNWVARCCVLYFAAFCCAAAVAHDSALSRTRSSLSPDYSTCGLCHASSYECELLHVWTEDGYELGVHHLSGASTLGARGSASRPAVLMVHGLSSNSACYVANLPNDDLAFMLVDAGFDVFLLNARGTSYSQTHRSLSIHDRRFWEYSWTEVARYDVPAAMDLIKQASGRERVILVGHSEGGTVCTTFLALQEHEQYKSRVALFLALAPAIFVTHTKQEVFILVDKLHGAKILADLGVFRLCGGKLSDYLETETCKLLPTLCDVAVNAMAGWDYDNMNKSRMDIYLSASDCSSVQNYCHGFQVMDEDEFRFFDYGSAEENKKHYNVSSPPLIPLNLISGTPVALFYGERDKFVDQYDVENSLIPQMSSANWVPTTPRLVPKWSHADFVWSMDGKPFEEMVDMCLAYA